MKPAIHTLLLLFMLAGAACSSTVSHRITLRDGREVHARGKPELQRKTGYYRYKDPQGRDALLRADDVLRVTRD
jgi:hypothetical protein